MINQNTIRNVDIPANLFSNLGGKDYSINNTEAENDIVKTNNLLAEDMKEYYERDIKLNKFNNNRSYRTRIENMYQKLKGLEPIDNEIKDTIFTNNYVEKGIVIKPTISELKQFWTEYRLMNNEQKNNINTFDNPTQLYTDLQGNKKEFDDLFNKLTSRVEEINHYIDELKEMKEEMDKRGQNLELNEKELEENRQRLETERQDFLNFKQVEEEKNRKEKENLKINFNRLQTIIDSLNNKLNEVE